MQHSPRTTWSWTKAEPAAPPAAGRKPMSPQERARHAALVRWGKKNPLAARLAALREKRKAKGKGAGGAAAPKPDKAAEQAAERTKNLGAIGEALMDADAALNKNDLAALAAFAAGGALDPKAAQYMASVGLVTLGADGTPRLSADGKRFMRAAEKGDVRGALDTLGEAGDKAKTEAAEKPAAAGALSKKEPAAEKPKKGGGGGGGGGKEEKKPEANEEADEKTQQALDAVGLKPGDLDALRAAAEGGSVDEAQIDGLAEDGLVEPDGKGGFITTDAGRRALRALERGDVRGYRAALQDVGAARGRQADKEKRKTDQDTARTGREQAREAAQAARDKATADKEAAALDDLADDFRRGRRGLSFAEQRKLIRAGRARLNGEKFELKRLALELDLLELSI